MMKKLQIHIDMKRIRYFIIFIIKYFIAKVLFLFTPTLSIDKTIKTIIDKKASVSRFGDGELMWMSGGNDNVMQKSSPALAADLTNAIKNKENVVICINEKLLLRRLNQSEEDNKKYYLLFFNTHFFEIIKLIPKNNAYGTALFSRVYREFPHHRAEYYLKTYAHIKNIYYGMNVLMVEGYHVMFGVGNDLLEGANSIKRILCPSNCSYEIINTIKETVLNYSQGIDIVLAVLGPTSTILSCILSDYGIRTIDIGSLNEDYMVFLNDFELLSKRKQKTKDDYEKEIVVKL